MAGTVAYLSGTYARASDSFIRGEIAQLRGLGWTVHTFAVRPPADSEITSDEIRRERDKTDYLLAPANRWALLRAVLRQAFRAPVALYKAVALAGRCAPSGLKARVTAMAYVAEACLLAERLAAKRVQHVHVHIAEGAAVVAMLAADRLGIPFSMTIHGPGEFDYAPSLAFDQKVARAAFAVSVSEWGRAQLQRWVSEADWHKVHVVRCGVEDRFKAQPETPVPADPRLVFVGRLVHNKGVLPLIDAARVLAGEGLKFRLTIIGDGPLRGRVEDLVQRHALRDHIELRGWAKGDEVRDEILRSRAFVLPSYAENLPVAIMEALALSRPVISTFIGGIPELVTPDCGWLVPAGSSVELLSAMRAALTLPPEDLAAMGRRGARRVAERHDARTEAAKLAALWAIP
jgi:glycosyltransferase involved in cell wall biosynthesis